MIEETVAHTTFSRSVQIADNGVTLGSCVNCGSPYDKHMEVSNKRPERGEPYYYAFCPSATSFLKEKRANPNDGGGRRKSVPEAKH